MNNNKEKNETRKSANHVLLLMQTRSCSIHVKYRVNTKRYSQAKQNIKKPRVFCCFLHEHPSEESRYVNRCEHRHMCLKKLSRTLKPNVIVERDRACTNAEHINEPRPLDHKQTNKTPYTKSRTAEGSNDDQMDLKRQRLLCMIQNIICNQHLFTILITTTQQSTLSTA